MAQRRVVIVVGSDSEWEVMKACWDQLEELGIRADVQVMSAHRSPERVHEFAAQAGARGVEVVIAGAALAGALAGNVAARDRWRS